MESRVVVEPRAGKRADVSSDETDAGRKHFTGLSPRFVASLAVVLIVTFIPWLTLRVVFGQLWWGVGGLIVIVAIEAWLWRRSRR